MDKYLNFGQSLRLSPLNSIRYILKSLAGTAHTYIHFEVHVWHAVYCTVFDEDTCMCISVHVYLSTCVYIYISVYVLHDYDYGDNRVLLNSLKIEYASSSSSTCAQCNTQASQQWPFVQLSGCVSDQHALEGC